MDGKTSIVDKVVIYGRTYMAQYTVARSSCHFVCAESFCVLKKTKISSP